MSDGADKVNTEYKDLGKCRRQAQEDVEPIAKQIVEEYILSRNETINLLINRGFGAKR